MVPSAQYKSNFLSRSSHRYTFSAQLAFLSSIHLTWQMKPALYMCLHRRGLRALFWKGGNMDNDSSHYRLAQPPVQQKPCTSSCALHFQHIISQEEKKVIEDEMVGWHHQFTGHELGQTPGDGKGPGSLVCSSPWS